MSYGVLPGEPRADFTVRFESGEFAQGLGALGDITGSHAAGTDIDNQEAGECPASVRRLRSSIAVVLLALWMPATLYCEMEAAGLFAECGTCQPDKGGGGATIDCDADGGGLIESGSFRLRSDSIVLIASDATDWLLRAWLPRNGAEFTLVSLDRTTAPPELIHTWQFVERAAPPPRAPTFMA